MNSRALFIAPFLFTAAPLLLAQSEPAPQPPVPVAQAQPDTTRLTLLTPPAGENQRVYGPAQSSLITPEAAQALVGKFQAAYGQANSPRIVIYVNRALIDTESGLKLTAHTEKVYESTKADKGAPATTTTEVSREKTYAAGEAAKPALADQQTVREVERLFGRVFRHGGARLADQKAAGAMFVAQPGVPLSGEQGAKEREALKQVADIAIEVLISSRSLTVTEVSGDLTYTVPDIQATAIRLSDAAILGQAAASDVLGGGTQATRIARQFGVRDITEATAFALMEDMLTAAK